MIRKIIHINEDLCIGCGACAAACHEGAIGMVDGKAKLLRDDYCDGMGDCLPECPTGAITFEEREAEAYNGVGAPKKNSNWPIQIKLAPVSSPYYCGAKLLIAADCTAFSYADFHKEFKDGRVCLIGCPKLDAVDYSEKLTEIIKNNDITEIILLRMEVPCCGRLETAVKKANIESGKFLPLEVVTVTTEGKIIK